MGAATHQDMLFHVRDEGEPLRWGFNVYPEGSSCGSGFVFRWNTRLWWWRKRRDGTMVIAMSKQPRRPRFCTVEIEILPSGD